MLIVWNEIMGSIEDNISDKKLWTNWMTLSDPQERKTFEKFGASRVSSNTAFFLFLVTLIRYTYSAVMDFWHVDTLLHQIYPLLIITVCNGVVYVPSYALGWLAKKHRQDVSKTPIVAFAVKYLPFIEVLMAIGSVSSVGIRTILRAAIGSCISYSQSYVWICNAGHESRMLMDDSSFILMLLPILFTIVLKSLHFKVILLSWLISVISLGIAIGISGATNSLAIFIIYIPLSLIILFEIQRQDLILYFLVKQQSMLLAENKQMAEDQQTELRHMIANVAHDLKTPLSALTNGFETISDLTSEGMDTVFRQEQAGTVNSADVVPFATSIHDIVNNLTNVSSFMIMTINRCIDFTKASKGLQLISKPETINLSEILALPISCMKDLQTRMSIDLLPLPTEICSHIITDKQWLQENLFCLISNAVKYSSSGSITISVSEITTHHDLIEKVTVASALSTKYSSIHLPEDTNTSTAVSSQASNASARNHEQHAVRSGKHSPIVNSAGSDYSYLDQLDQRPIQSKKTLHRASTDSAIRYSIAPCENTCKPHSCVSEVDSGLPPLHKGVKNKSQNNKVGVDTETDVALAHIIIPPLSDDKRPLLLFEVEDTGIGMSDEVMAGLFSPFKQAQRRAGGTGLGLYSLAKRLEALGGYYGVQRRKDGKEGSLFWFAIPYTPDEPIVSSDGSSKSRPTPRTSTVHAADDIAGQKTEHLLPLQEPQLTSTAGVPAPLDLHILLVDDSLPIVKMTTMLLKRQKYVVTQAENGAEALARIAERKAMRDESGAPLPPFDVVLMDLNMPVMDGLEATTRIRAQGKLDGISAEDRQFIVGLSANSDHQTMMEAYESGVDDFMCKPFSLQTFHECYNKHIHK